MQRMSAKRGVASFVVVLVIGAWSIWARPAEAQVPKSGTAKVHSGWASTGTTTKVGDNRLYWSGVYWGFSFNDEGKGFAHKMAWNCPAVTEILDGRLDVKGNCTMTDMDGDKIFGMFEGKGPIGGNLEGVHNYHDGTGKYKGIKGSHTFQCQGVGTDGQLFCHQQVTYQMP